ncbi:hypothetical protein TELCIR_04333 [Teladorsagia circumcincta]|uniref:Uncharacterized protein n=1 Tax=Teladorsagia circumcincta TaxID=45464 RepID=A0A2G9UVE5_TELCI|nr:hypothetical protein TELCIR_04333 [Teladorsagia circumcincta]
MENNNASHILKRNRLIRIFLAKQIVDKLNQPWNHFVCAETSNGHCKVSDSIQICSYGRGLVVVMGMPLWFNETEKSKLGRIHKWITDCHAPRRETAAILAEIRKKIKNPGVMKASTTIFVTSTMLLASVLVLSSW